MPSLSNVTEFNTQNLSMPEINKILDNAIVKTSFTGKRTIILNQSTFSLKNPHTFCTTSFESLSKALADNLHKYPITKSPSFIDSSFMNKFDLTPKEDLQKHKNEIDLSKAVLKKLTSLEDLSKEQIKKSNIITRIFFFFTNFFNNIIFSYNLKRASVYIATHEKIISKKEIILKPFDKYHKVNTIFSVSTGLMTSINIFFQIFGINGIPYVSKILNAATMITISKIAYSHFTNAINMI